MGPLAFCFVAGNGFEGAQKLEIQYIEVAIRGL